MDLFVIVFITILNNTEPQEDPPWWIETVETARKDGEK